MPTINVKAKTARIARGVIEPWSPASSGQIARVKANEIHRCECRRNWVGEDLVRGEELIRGDGGDSRLEVDRSKQLP